MNTNQDLSLFGHFVHRAAIQAVMDRHPSDFPRLLSAEWRAVDRFIGKNVAGRQIMLEAAMHNPNISGAYVRALRLINAAL